MFIGFVNSPIGYFYRHYCLQYGNGVIIKVNGDPGTLSSFGFDNWPLSDVLELEVSDNPFLIESYSTVVVGKFL